VVGSLCATTKEWIVSLDAADEEDHVAGHEEGEQDEEDEENVVAAQALAELGDDVDESIKGGESKDGSAVD